MVFLSEDARFIVGDLTTGKAVAEIPFTSERRDLTRAAAYTPDGKRLITADHGDIAVRDAATGRRLNDQFHTGNVTGLAWSPDGKRLATCAERDHVARVWDAATGKQLLTLTGHTGGIDAVAWSPDGARLATWGQDQTLRLWTADGREAAKTTVEVKYPSNLFFTPAGPLLAVASGGAVAWDPREAKPRPLAESLENVFTSFLVRNGTALVVWRHGEPGLNEVSIRDPATGTVRVRHAIECEYLLAASPDARAALCRQPNGDLELLNLVDGRRRWVYPPAKEDKGHPAHPGTFAPDGRTIAVSRWDHGLRILEVATGAERQVIRHPTERVYALAFSPDGTRLAAAGGRSVLIWDVTRPTVAQPRSAEAAWADLASPDAAVGFAAIRACVAHPAETVRLARERVQPVAVPDEKQVAKWIEQLDAPRFAVREAATRALTDLGEPVQQAVRDALKGPRVPGPAATGSGPVRDYRRGPAVGRAVAVGPGGGGPGADRDDGREEGVGAVSRRGPDARGLTRTASARAGRLEEAVSQNRSVAAEPRLARVHLGAGVRRLPVLAVMNVRPSLILGFTSRGLRLVSIRFGTVPGLRSASAGARRFPGFTTRSWSFRHASLQPGP